MRSIAFTKEDLLRLHGSLTRFISFIAVLFAALPARADDSLVRRFETEAPQSWQEYLDRVSQLQFNVSARIDVVSGDVALSNYTAEYLQRGASARSVLRSEDGKVVVAAVNPRYYFRLSRASERAAWQIDDFGPSSSGNEESSYIRNSVRKNAADAIRAMTPDRGPLLSELMHEGTFTVKRATLESGSEENLVRVEFSYMPTPENLTKRILRSGWVLLDADNHWIIRRFEYLLEWPDGTKGKETGEYVYADEPVNGVPVPHRILRHTEAHESGTGQPVEYDIHYTFDSWREEEVPEREFTLAAFGLPEPGLGSDRGRPIWYWLILGSAAFFLLAILLYRRARAT